MFTVYPAVGVIPASSSIQIAVDMMGETTCYAEEVSLCRLFLGWKRFVAVKLSDSYDCKIML